MSEEMVAHIVHWREWLTAARVRSGEVEGLAKDSLIFFGTILNVGIRIG